MNDKNIENSGAMEVPAAPARAHIAGDGAAGAGPVGRFSAQRKPERVNNNETAGLRD